MVTHTRQARLGDVGCLKSVLYSRLLLRLGLFLVDVEHPRHFLSSHLVVFLGLPLIRYLRAMYCE